MGSQLAAPAAAGAHPVEESSDMYAAPPATAPLAAAETVLPGVGAAIEQIAATHRLHPAPDHTAHDPWQAAPDLAGPESTPTVDTAATSPPAGDHVHAPAPDPAASWNWTPPSVSSWVPQPLAVAPVSGTVTSAFGPRWGATHSGLDIANSIGTPVYAAAAGTVIDSGPASGFGLWVQIRHDDGSTSTYGHINETLVAAGQQVQAGEQIATVGNRGESTGPHLHFETTDPDGTKVDPIQWLSARGVAQTDLSRT
ncbi:M23 family metallopeptidase [Rhodococcus pyridinivorans]|uniref:M23 family metallopeptidase n=1 Tax=Rhodococcus TaxID=1827 RepID=UPI001E4FDC4D|nr:M23 family metallopeptidase [Rhodococcus pyridinivorans]UGQ56254.1 M23 family metallopeptidase [Rhodococcus pyridinivorans]